MNNVRQAGFTLIEMVIFIVVVSVGVAGILSVMNFTVQHSADPMVRKQAAALADSVLEEIILKDYVDPDGGINVVEAGRDSYDDVDDYNGLSNAAFNLPTSLSSYLISIAVTDGTATLGVIAKKIKVTVSSGNESIIMTGYRASY